MSQDKPPDKETASLNDIWEQLDEKTRALIIEMFAHLGYQLGIAGHIESAKGDKDGSSKCDTKDPTRSP
jgi:hypothetical protein